MEQMKWTLTSTASREAGERGGRGLGAWIRGQREGKEGGGGKGEGGVGERWGGKRKTRLLQS